MPVDVLAVAGGSFTIIGVVLSVSLGLTGAIVALIRLPSDKSLSSLTQAQGANEALVQTLAAVERERDYWHRRFEECAAQQTRLVNAIGLRDRLKDDT